MSDTQSNSLPDDVFVYDMQSHALNIDPSNYRPGLEREASLLVQMMYAMMQQSMSTEHLLTYDSFCRDWSVEECANLLFLESDTDVSTFVPLTIGSFSDGICSVDKAVEAKERWPQRFQVAANIDPLWDNALEEFERQVELLNPLAVKLYPSSYAKGHHEGWHMDDPKIAYPVFDKARELGVKIISIHKALPVGPVPIESYRVGDLDAAAHDYPDLIFEVIHGGLAFAEETAWQLARFPNIHINMDVTSLLAWTYPRRFAQILVGLMSIGGHDIIDRIHWATGGGTAAYHPQPALEAFWNFQIPEDMFTQGQFSCEPYQFTELDKRKIIGLNSAELYGVDVEKAKAGIANDEFSERVAANGGKFAPWSTTGGVLEHPTAVAS